MAMKLTKRSVTALKANGERREVRDTELKGFSVRIAPTGEKTFAVMYRAGKGRGAPKRRMTLGTFGPVTVDQARNEANQILAAVSRGEDPAEARDAEKRARSVADVGAEWLEDLKAHRKPRTVESYAWLWRTVHQAGHRARSRVRRFRGPSTRDAPPAPRHPRQGKPRARRVRLVSHLLREVEATAPALQPGA